MRVFESRLQRQAVFNHRLVKIEKTEIENICPHVITALEVRELSTIRLDSYVPLYSREIFKWRTLG